MKAREILARSTFTKGLYLFWVIVNAWVLQTNDFFCIFSICTYIYSDFVSVVSGFSLPPAPFLSSLVPFLLSEYFILLLRCHMWEQTNNTLHDWVGTLVGCSVCRVAHPVRKVVDILMVLHRIHTNFGNMAIFSVIMGCPSVF